MRKQFKAFVKKLLSLSLILYSAISVAALEMSFEGKIAKLNLRSRDLEILTSTQNDESPCIAPNGNVILYATKDGSTSYLAGVNISSKVKFKLPALYGELKEPSWSPFLR